MRIVVFGPQRRVGALQDDRVIDLNLAFASYAREKRNSPDPFALADERVPALLFGFIARGAAGLDDARAALEHVAANGSGEPVVFARSAVQLHPPSVYRPRIACAGGNYALHAAGAQTARTGAPAAVDEIYRQSRATGPWGFWKVVDPLAGDQDEVVYPARATHFDYEGEVAIVLGKPARDVPVERAAEYIWGVTLLNDWSVRNDMGAGRPMSFNLPKNFDTSVSLGPAILAGECDVQGIDVETRVNGAVRQHYNTREMTFSFAEFLAYLSRDFTFHPGDMIAGGTGAGTAMDTTRLAPDGSTPTDLFLKVGDVVEVASPSIGVLHSRIIAR